jgi:hypothetical protein
LSKHSRPQVIAGANVSASSRQSPFFSKEAVKRDIILYAGHIGGLGRTGIHGCHRISGTAKGDAPGDVQIHFNFFVILKISNILFQKVKIETGTKVNKIDRTACLDLYQLTEREGIDVMKIASRLASHAKRVTTMNRVCMDSIR